MAGKSSNFANELLKLIFNGTPIANIADNAASSPITNWELSLHTALPTSGQNHNEVTYTGYARVAVTAWCPLQMKCAPCLITRYRLAC